MLALDIPSEGMWPVVPHDGSVAFLSRGPALKHHSGFPLKTAGMTEGWAGMTEGRVGMTEGRVGMTEERAGMTENWEHDRTFNR